MENVKETLNIDVATGDPVTPSTVRYRYKCMFDDEVLEFQAYNFETILAEKLQTILARGVLNSRSKDFFDLFLIHALRWNDVNIPTLKKAFANTCDYRNTIFQKVEAIQILNNIRNDSRMEARWNSYRKKNKYVGTVEFQEAVEAALTIANCAFDD